MTNEELDHERAYEAKRLFWSGNGGGKGDVVIAARLARENWKPPEPVDPDVLAFRGWIYQNNRANHEDAYLAGARMARQQEQERAKVLLKTLDEIGRNGPPVESIQARTALAAYKVGRAAR
jgi:hypothetical protein